MEILFKNELSDYKDYLNVQTLKISKMFFKNTTNEYPIFETRDRKILFRNDNAIIIYSKLKDKTYILTNYIFHNFIGKINIFQLNLILFFYLIQISCINIQLKISNY